MIRKCTLEDKKDWVRLNKQFIEYEYKDENVWNSPLKFGNLEEDFELILNDTSTILFAIIEKEKMEKKSVSIILAENSKEKSR